MDKASDSLQVFALVTRLCHLSLLVSPSFRIAHFLQLQILINSTDAHARATAAADLAAGADPASLHSGSCMLIIFAAVSCEYQFAEWLLSVNAAGALHDVFTLLLTCEGEVLRHVCHAGDA